MASKLFGALSLCKKAGKFAAGFDAVRERIAKNEAKLVLVAKDASDGTKRRIRNACENGNCKFKEMPLLQQDVAMITRKPVGVVAVTDQDLAELCLKALPDEEELV